MRFKNRSVVVVSMVVAGAWGLFSVKAHAQAAQQAAAKTSDSSDKPYDWKASFAKVKVGKVPRMPDGKPSLQGIWSFSILTPLERPGNQKATEVTAADAEEAEDAAQKAEIALRVESTVTTPGEKTTDAYNSFWRDGYWYKIPMTTLHTSQVVDPPNGRVPPLTTAAAQRGATTKMRLDRPALGPEDRPTTSRCLVAIRQGPPITGQGPGSQETTMQIIQGPDVVNIRQESLHSSQLVYLDGRQRPADSVHLYKGAARGHWDGDTLVVDDTNFADWATGVFVAYGNTPQMHIQERWKRLDDTHLLYGFTIDDPGTWTKPWSAEFVLWRMTNQEQLVEYACNEGNVGVQFTLSAARLKEKEAAAAAEKLANAASAPAIDLSRPLAVVVPTGKSSNALGMDFVMVSPGEFRMGCSVEAPPEKLAFPTNCNNDEKPTHIVQITKPFEIQTTETTEKQWMAMMGSNPSAYKDDVNFPVEQVSFEDVETFLQKLNAQNDGYTYRLPTEAEWEYAARGGTSDPYAGPVREAWYNANPAAASGQGTFNIRAFTGTHTVATKKPNPWGLYDMRGNVMEWVQDYYDPNYYSESPAADPKGPAKGDTRVVRGGSYHVYPWLTSVSVRTQFPEAYSFEDVGFRVVREKKQ